MKLDDLIATARIIAADDFNHAFVRQLARAVIDYHEGKAGKLRAELIAWAKNWRTTDGKYEALDQEGMALVDALAIAEHEEARRG